jgi:hypothetical protein
MEDLEELAAVGVAGPGRGEGVMARVHWRSP